MNKLKILIIDDSPEDQVAYKRYLGKAFSNIEINTANTGAQGIEFLATNDVDCVLLDYNLPDTTGIKFLDRIKQQYELSLPVIMLTGQGNDMVAVEALKLGATDYLIKSEIASGMLRQAILNAIENSNWHGRSYSKNKK